jgi:REP element-mobilizing transposase RayT
MKYIKKISCRHNSESGFWGLKQSSKGHPFFFNGKWFGTVEAHSWTESYYYQMVGYENNKTQ